MKSLCAAQLIDARANLHKSLCVFKHTLECVQGTPTKLQPTYMVTQYDSYIRRKTQYAEVVYILAYCIVYERVIHAHASTSQRACLFSRSHTQKRKLALHNLQEAARTVQPHHSQNIHTYICMYVRACTASLRSQSQGILST